MNAMRMHAAMTQNSRYFSQLGIIAAYDESRHMAQVILQTSFEDDPQLQTGWLRIATPWVGSGWGMYSAPTYGSMCTIHYQEGNINTGFISLFLNTVNQAPPSVPQGELWIVHQSGSSIKMTEDGLITIIGSPKVVINGTNVDINVTGKVNIESDSDMELKSQTKIKIDAPMVEIGDTHTMPTPLLPLVKQGGAPTVNVKGS